MIPLTRYPKDYVLRDGTRLLFRPMVPGDVDALWDFYRLIPREDRLYFREDIDHRDVVRKWAEELDYATVLPILAFDGARVVGDATLHRPRSGWKRRLGFIRIQVAPDFRHRGLGTAMIRELRHLGEKMALRYLIAEIIEEQQAAVRSFEKLGFEKVVVLPNYVSDADGRFHNLAVLHYAMAEAPEGEG